MRMRRGIVVLSLVGLACSTPPAPPQPRTGLAVVASFGKTWDAVIEEFAARNVPIRSMDRASGFIASDPLEVKRDEATDYADCGTAIGTQLHTDRVSYNVLVRGDSTKSNVKITSRFTFGGHASSLAGNATQQTECSSTGLWETKTEAAIRNRAEGKKP